MKLAIQTIVPCGILAILPLVPTVYFPQVGSGGASKISILHRPDRSSQWVWVQTKPNRLGPYLVYEVFEPKTLERRVYLRTGLQATPKLIYTHFRGISVLLGNKHTRLLVNDEFATKGNKVVVIDLRTAQQRDLGQEVMKKYEAEVSHDPRCVLIPNAHAFSQDDTRVLIKVELIYLSSSSFNELSRIKSSYKPRWYVVDASTGGILKEYSTNHIPEEW